MVAIPLALNVCLIACTNHLILHQPFLSCFDGLADHWAEILGLEVGQVNEDLELSGCASSKRSATPRKKRFATLVFFVGSGS